jgi:hypothetical protein
MLLPLPLLLPLLLPLPMLLLARACSGFQQWGVPGGAVTGKK